MSLTTVKKFQLPTILDERGNLSVFENDLYFPFRIKWVSWFWTDADISYDAEPDYQADGRIMVILSGSMKLVVSTIFAEEEEIILNDTCNCIYIPPMTGLQLRSSHKNTTAFIASEAPVGTEKPDIHFLSPRKASYEQYQLLG